MRVLIAMLVWAAAIAGGVGVSSVVADSIHTKAATASIDVSSITATGSRSLFRTANFTRVLATATTKLGADAQVDSFTLYPGYLSVDAIKGSTDMNLYVSTTGTVDLTDSSATPSGDKLFPLSDVSSSFPATFSQRITSLAHAPASELHYMIVEVDPETKRLQWYAYPVTGSSVEYFQMNGPHGRLFEEFPTSGLQPVKR